MVVTLEVIFEKLLSIEKELEEMKVEMRETKVELKKDIVEVKEHLSGIGGQFEVSAKHRQDAEENLSKTLKYLLDTTTAHAIELHAIKHKQ